jgi:phosphoribosylformimino-5-aminoimidazole carboxamide ribotide isomerase
MLIPSIDLMGGKIVQLIQGQRKALEFDDFEFWVERFGKYPIVQLIDLDAAMGKGDNRSLVGYFSRRLPCQVGGGIRSIEVARAALEAGAQKVIVGSALVREGEVDQSFALSLADAVGPEKLIFAVDSKNGWVATEGWRSGTAITAETMMQALEPHCGAFLYTHIDTEGLMQGIPLDVVRRLREATNRRLIVAGGITSLGEIELLDAMKVDAVVGMAIYTGRLVDV